MEIARAEVRLTERDERAFAKYLRGGSKRKPGKLFLSSFLVALIIPVALLLASIAPGISWSDIAIAMGGWVIAALLLALLRMTREPKPIQKIGNRSDRVFVFYTEHYTIAFCDEAGGDARERTYHDFTDAIQLNDALYLLDKKDCYHILPRRCITGSTMEALSEHIKAKLSESLFAPQDDDKGCVAKADIKIDHADERNYRKFIYKLPATKKRRIRTFITFSLMSMVGLAVIIIIRLLKHEPIWSDSWITTIVYWTILTLGTLFPDSKSGLTIAPSIFSIRFFNARFDVRKYDSDRDYYRTYPYDYYVKASETQEAIYLHAGINKDFVIPKRCLTQGTAEELSALLKGKLGANFRVL